MGDANVRKGSPKGKRLPVQRDRSVATVETVSRREMVYRMCQKLRELKQIVSEVTGVGSLVTERKRAMPTFVTSPCGKPSVGYALVAPGFSDGLFFDPAGAAGLLPDWRRAEPREAPWPHPRPLRRARVVQDRPGVG